MDFLSDEVLLNIFSNLNLKDVGNMSLTCVKFSRLCQDHYVWKSLYQRDFSSFKIPFLIPDKGLYKCLCKIGVPRKVEKIQLCKFLLEKYPSEFKINPRYPTEFQNLLMYTFIYKRYVQVIKGNGGSVERLREISLAILAAAITTLLQILKRPVELPQVGTSIQLYMYLDEQMAKIETIEFISIMLVIKGFSKIFDLDPLFDFAIMFYYRKMIN